MALGELYQLRLQATFLGEQLENSFFYLHTLGSANAGALNSNFIIDVLPSIQAILSAGTVFSQLVTVNLDDPTDFSTAATAVTGTRAGEAAPPFVSWGFVLQTPNRSIRSGGKRFGGISETDIIDGVATGSVITSLDNLAAVLPVAIQNPGFTEAWNLALHTDGNLATSGAPLTVLVGSSRYARVTTQSSRKFS